MSKLPMMMVAAAFFVASAHAEEAVINGPADKKPADSQAYYGAAPLFPSPYVATLQKVLPSGDVTIRGNSADTAHGALRNLERTWREYFESGGWGGPG